MRNAFFALALALGLAACGSERATCEKVMKRATECVAPLADIHADVKASVNDLAADDVLLGICKDSKIAGQVAPVASCLDETTCDAFNACLEKSGNSLFGVRR